MFNSTLNHTIDTWINAIQQYNFKQLCMQPDENTWSIGQVCIHLVKDTNWFIGQIKICISNNDNVNETMSTYAQTILLNNAFPDEKLSNPANINIPQPQSKEALLQLFINLKKDINKVIVQIENNISKGKTKHPGFNYFNAIEWLQFAAMHLRHHLKQKKRIDEFLKLNEKIL